MRIEDFSPAVPTDHQRELLECFNAVFGKLAEHIIEAVEPSAHRTAALRKLLESKMTLIHGVTHTQEK